MADESETKALATEVPSNQDVLRSLPEAFAQSPKDIKPGQAIALTNDGVAYGRSKVSRSVMLWRGGIYAALIGAPLLLIAGATLPGVVLYAASAIPFLQARYYQTGSLLAIDVIIRQGSLDEAQKRFDTLAHLRRRNPVPYCFIAGNLASHRGNYAEAIKWWREAFPRAKGITRPMLTTSITKALILSEQLVEAQRVAGSVPYPAEADPVLTTALLERVMFALHDPRATLSIDELHELTRQCLEYSHTGVELAAIGWAFERTGEAEMAQFCATEAVDRMHYRYLATWWPALQQWLDEHTKQV